MSNMNNFTGLFLAAGVVVLSGCAGWEKHMRETLPEPKPAYAEREIVVAPTRSVHEVDYRGANVFLNHSQQAHLMSFLHETTRDKANVVMIEEPMGNSDPLMQRRVREVRNWLERMGFKTDTFVPVDPPVEGRLLIAVDHISASVPGCPDWEFHDYAAFGSQPFPNMGCADRENLAAMIADPTDLVAGAMPHPPQGEAPIRGEVNYRLGEVEELDEAQAEGELTVGQ